jgi:MFS family permease
LQQLPLLERQLVDRRQVGSTIGAFVNCDAMIFSRQDECDFILQRRPTRCSHTETSTKATIQAVAAVILFTVAFMHIEWIDALVLPLSPSLYRLEKSCPLCFSRPARTNPVIVPGWRTNMVDTTASSRPSHFRLVGLQYASSATTSSGIAAAAVVLKARLSSDSDTADDMEVSDTVSTRATTTASTASTWSWLGTLVIPLWLVYVSNQWSRSSLYYLVNFDVSATDSALTAMNVDLGFDQAQYGILASLAFTTLFAVASLGAGYASDRWNRKTLTIASAVGWSVATLGTSVAEDYTTVLAWRIAMGLACAFATPTAYTLIRDRVPRTQQATASSLYGTGVALGSGLASLTLLLDTTVGWRLALEVIGGTGLAAALLALLVLPNDNERMETTSTVVVATSPADDDRTKDVPLLDSIVQDVRESVSSDRAQWIYLASLLRFSSGLCIGVWGAPYFRMAFADRTNDYSVIQAVISAVGASASGVLGGTIADRLSSRMQPLTAPTNTAPSVDLVGRRLWVPVVGSLLAAPTWYGAVHSADSFEVSMAWLAASYFVAECWFGPTISTLQATVGPKVGGTAQGLFTLTGAMANLSPTLLGFLFSQAVASGSTIDTSVSQTSSSVELSSLLSAAVCFGYLSSAACFAMAARASPEPKDGFEVETR